MIGAANGNRVSITGLGSSVPERVVTNDELAETLDTSDEWIVARTGIRERRVAGPNEALSDFCLPASREALERAGVRAEDLDLVIVATVTPDM
jgi:3-oxoacyl-[acyl-carrier-protein] synthase-3